MPVNQHMSVGTRCCHHPRADNTVSMVEATDPGLSDGLGKVSRDHLAVILKAYASRPAPLRKTVPFRIIRSTDVDSFKRNIQNSKALSDSLCVNNADGRRQSP